MTVSKKMKTIDNKIEKNKARYNLVRQIPKISNNVLNYQKLKHGRKIDVKIG